RAPGLPAQSVWGRLRKGAAPPPSSLAVDVFAGGRRGRNGRVPLLPQKYLPEPDRPALGGDGRAGQVQAARAVDLLAHEGARLVGAGLEPLHPGAAGARGVEAEVVEVHDRSVAAVARAAL